ncbi:hypothetical protein Psi02_58750 [Planotetraspora silvatica]|uniref:Beta-lactamase-related domain-containing protein n=1 Tax=Planotetraspora silvatica TaxID=234614 RepID=A0A8J3URU2_9ACTN|nr:serine hydrolase domain-containing protein [Planotetraspora silvatica]GII49451.1 hypothetical protein Psi02_58750 [Planotetraspora silvatica]
MLEGLAEHGAEVVAAGGCASVSVAVAQGDSVVHAEAFGLADVAMGRRATTDTAYLVASVTKPVTATAVCVAADAGSLDLDAPVEDYLPGCRLPRFRMHRTPTVRELLQHRGGLGIHHDFFYADSPVARAAARRTVERYGTLYREPGSRFEYSNLGYGILDMVLESVTGQDPADYVREQVFGPLGLTSCHIGPAYHGPAQEALRYTADGRVYPVYDSTHRGASLAWGTAADLAVFGLSQAGGRGVLRPGTAAEMRAAAPIDDRLGYGLGWFVSRGGRHTVLSHSGSMGGVAALLAVVPDLRLSVCVLTNQSGGQARTSVAEHVLTELVDGFTPDLLPPGDERERPVAVPAGSWEGRVRVAGAADVSIALRLHADGRAEAGVDGGEMIEAQIVTASDYWDLRVGVPLQLPTADALVNSPYLGLELDLRGDALVGAARAMKNGEGDGLLGNCYSHWCELEPRRN